MVNDALREYERKKQRLTGEIRDLADGVGTVGIGGKTSSNLFRYRDRRDVRKIDVSDFTSPISIDGGDMVAYVEGMITYEDLVKETLRYGLLPAVVPELRSITVGGAATGIGIESSSFRHGFVHETVREMEILLGDGRIVTCSPDNAYSDLYFGFPNSYGTLGYALKLAIGLVPAKPFVFIRHRKYADAASFFADLSRTCETKMSPEGPVDFVDGVVFGRDKLVLTTGRFVDSAPAVSDYTYLGIYYRSLLEKETDYLTASDYIWRWDTDWFWCSKHFFAQNPLVRRLIGRSRLRSTFYWKVKALAHRSGFHVISEKFAGRKESVVQDVEIPIGNAAAFLDFFHDRIGITPVWICPVMPQGHGRRYPLYAMDPGDLHVNFGFWDVVRTDQPDGFHNRLVENVVEKLGGRKSLYSTSFYPEEEFWRQHDREAYRALRAKYDPSGRFRDLYEKCVKGK